MYLPSDLAFVLLDIHSREIKIYVHTKLYRGMLIATLFIIAPNRKQCKCPSVSEWLNTPWSIHTMEDYSAITRKEYREQPEQIPRVLCSVNIIKLRCHILCDSVYIKFSKWQCCRVGEQMTSCQATVTESGEDWQDYKMVAQGSSFVDMEQLCVLIVMVVIEIYTLAQNYMQSHTHITAWKN